MIVITFDKQSM